MLLWWCYVRASPGFMFVFHTSTEREYFKRERRREDRLGPSFCAPPRKPSHTIKVTLSARNFANSPNTDRKGKKSSNCKSACTREPTRKLILIAKMFAICFALRNRFVVVYISGALAVLFSPWRARKERERVEWHWP